MPFSPLLGSPKPQFFDNNGMPLVGGMVEFFAAGTSTPLDTYTDTSGATPNTNPVILNSRGEPPMQINGADTVGYKVVLKSAVGDVLWTEDNLFTANSSGTGVAPPATFPFLNGTLFKSANFIVAAIDRGKLIVATANSFTITLNSSEVIVEGFVITVVNRGNAAVTIAAGTDTVNGNATATLLPGEHIILTADGVSQWNGPQHRNGIPFAQAAGTVDAMTADYIPNNVLVTGVIVQIKPVGQITVTTPTLAIDGLVAKTIVKDNNAALLLTDIVGASQSMLLQYDGTLDKWIYLNPPPPPIPSAFRGAMVTKLADEGKSDVTTSAVLFDVQQYEIGGVHSTTVNNTRLTVPANASKVSLNFSLYDLASAFTDVWLYKNGSRFFPGALALVLKSAFTGVMTVIPGDYFELYVTNNSGGIATITGGANGTWFSMHVIE